MSETIFVTGGAGFIGSNFVLQWLAKKSAAVINLDALTYAGNAESLAPLQHNPKHQLVQVDICDGDKIASLIREHRPTAIVHFAAESHVDRSIADPGAFIRTNVQGTLALLQQAKNYWSGLDTATKESFRFLHVSTDEVYGSLGPDDPAFFSKRPRMRRIVLMLHRRRAPDHLVRAYHHTYGFPTLTTNCSE